MLGAIRGDNGDNDDNDDNGDNGDDDGKVVARLAWIQSMDPRSSP